MRIVIEFEDGNAPRVMTWQGAPLVEAGGTFNAAVPGAEALASSLSESQVETVDAGPAPAPPPAPSADVLIARPRGLPDLGDDLPAGEAPNA